MSRKAEPSSAREALFDPDFLADLTWWVETDRATALRLLRLVEAVLRDPFSGILRRTSADRGNSYDVTVRQDWVGTRASAGFTYKDAGGAINNSDLPVYTRIEIRPILEGFVEKKLGRSLVLRVEGQNIGGAREIQTRTLFAVNAIDGRVSRRDRYDEYRDTRVAVRLRGQF